MGQLVMLRDWRQGIRCSKLSGMWETLQSAMVSPSRQGKAETRLEIWSKWHRLGFPEMYNRVIVGYLDGMSMHA